MLNSSIVNLGVKNITVIIYEIDVKRTADKPLLKDAKSIISNFAFIREIFEEIRDEDKAELLFFMAHNPLEMRLAIDAGIFDGFASYFNLIDVWASKFFDEIHSRSKHFIGIRPLARGILKNTFLKSNKKNDKNKRFYAYLSSLQKEGIWIGSLQSFAIKFALAHPVVKSVIVGMSKPEHVDELTNTASHPIPQEEFSIILNKMLEVAKNVGIRG